MPPFGINYVEFSGLIQASLANVHIRATSVYDPLTQDMKHTVGYSQFIDKVPIPNNSPCLRLGMRSVSGSNWNKAITFPTNSWAIRQEHWCEWRAHKMCIAKCLRCSLGLVRREERSHEHCRSMCVCVHLCMQTVASCLPSLRLHWSSSAFEHGITKINKSVPRHQRRKKRARFQTATRETRLKSGGYTGSLLSHSLFPLLLPVSCWDCSARKSQTALLIVICLGYMRLVIIKEAQGLFIFFY